MFEAFNITSPSPDTQHTALLAFSGEVRFGPSYYVLSIDDMTFGERIFGSAYLWSPSSNLFAVQEWFTLDYSEGPITGLVLIDVAQRREVLLDKATKRFLVPESFDEPSLTYRIDHGGPEKTVRRTIDTTQIADWKAIG